MKKIILLSGTSNKNLAQRIAHEINIPLGRTDIKTFSDGERHVEIYEDLHDSFVAIVQSGHAPADEHTFELLQLIDAAKRCGAQHICAVLPFYPYRREERAISGKECISAQLIAQLIEAAGADSVITCNLHTPEIMTFFSIPITNITLWKYYAPELQKIIKNPDRFCIVAPDKGSVVDSSIFAQLTHLPLIQAKKYRPGDDVVKIKCINGDIADKNIILIDDEINTAGTISTIALELKKLGGKEIFLAATHAVLSGPAIKNIAASGIKTIYISDTIPLLKSSRHPVFKIISSAPAIASAIKNEYSTHI